MLIIVKLNNDTKLFFKETTLIHKKKIWKKAKVFIQAGQAKVAPPISSILGQFGINLLDFCDKFNFKTRGLSAELTLLVFVSVYSNKTFSFKTKPVLLNELFFSFKLNNYIINSKDLIIALYKIYLVFSYSRDSNNLNTSFIFSNQNFKVLSGIVGYLQSYMFIKKKVI